MNRITLIGRIGQTPELRHTQSGKPVISFSLATSEKYTNQQGQKVEDTQWHNCIAWNKLAEIVDKYAFKGQQVALSGKMTYRNWTDKNGYKRVTAEVVVEEFQMLSKPEQPKPAADYTSTGQTRPPESAMPEDLPF